MFNLVGIKSLCNGLNKILILIFERGSDFAICFSITYCSSGDIGLCFFKIFGNTSNESYIIGNSFFECIGLFRRCFLPFLSINPIILFLCFTKARALPCLNVFGILIKFDDGYTKSG